MGNLDIWESVCTTDKAYTKRVNQRGGYTDINPMYRFRVMTEQFGPIGSGWGYEVLDQGIEWAHTNNEEQSPKALHWCRLRVWVVTEDDKGSWEHMGATEIYSNGKWDEDAHKKSVTDALGKALSVLGVCADVYLGEFDKPPARKPKKAAPKKRKELERPPAAERAANALQHLGTLGVAATLVEGFLGKDPLIANDDDLARLVNVYKDIKEKGMSPEEALPHIDMQEVKAQASEAF